MNSVANYTVRITICPGCNGRTVLVMDKEELRQYLNSAGLCFGWRRKIIRQWKLCGYIVCLECDGHGKVEKWI